MVKRKYVEDGLVSKIMKIPKGVLKHDDDDKLYVPMCNNSFHVGVIMREDVCVERKCKHYSRAYINNTEYKHGH